MSQKKEPRILIIEDDPFLLNIYKKQFETEGFKVSIATDGEAGLSAVYRKHPSIVLLDILLQKLNGFAVLEEIKRDPKVRHIPVVLLTNFGQKKDVERGFELGAADYLMKTHCKLSELVQKVREILDQHNSQHERG